MQAFALLNITSSSISALSCDETAQKLIPDPDPPQLLGPASKVNVFPEGTMDVTETKGWFEKFMSMWTLDTIQIYPNQMLPFVFFGADGDGDDDGDAHKPSLSQRSTHPLDCCMLMLPSGLVAWEWLVAIHEQAPLFTDSLHQHTLSFKAHFHEQTNSYGRDLSSYQKCRSSYT